jgi:hypothetical protein
MHTSSRAGMVGLEHVCGVGRASGYNLRTQ